MQARDKRFDVRSFSRFRFHITSVPRSDARCKKASYLLHDRLQKAKRPAHQPSLEFRRHDTCMPAPDARPSQDDLLHPLLVQERASLVRLYHNRGLGPGFTMSRI